MGEVDLAPNELSDECDMQILEFPRGAAWIASLYAVGLEMLGLHRSAGSAANMNIA
jgi:hypothetical protein